MKLQLYQQTIRNGEDHQAIYNGSNASQDILDIRLGNLFSLPASFSDTLTMLSFSDTGYYVYVIKPLFSRVGDYKALIVFVPLQIARTAASELGRVVNAMKECLIAGKDPSQLSHFFAKDYPQENLHFGTVRKTDRYAWRLYGKGMPFSNLNDFLEISVLQTYYRRYAGVFLVDAAQQKMIREGVMTDISQEKLVQPAWSMWLLDPNSPSPFVSSKSVKEEKRTKTKKKFRISPKFIAGLVVGLLLGGGIGWTVKALLTDEVPTPQQVPPVVLPNDSIGEVWVDTLTEDTLPIDTLLSEMPEPIL